MSAEVVYLGQTALVNEHSVGGLQVVCLHEVYVLTWFVNNVGSSFVDMTSRGTKELNWSLRIPGYCSVVWYRTVVGVSLDSRSWSGCRCGYIIRLLRVVL